VKSKLSVAALLVCASVNLAHAASQCLSYEPDRTKLSGRLERHTFPGRPNFENVAAGDEAETGFYLTLANPVCTLGDKDSAFSYPQEGITFVQLVLEQHGYARLRPYLNKRVTLTGQLFARFTGHHHAPLLLREVELAVNP
jgi:hypothetical protein